MTIAFVCLAALMLIAALAFVLTPLLRGSSVSADPAGEIERKRKALEQARTDGILTDEEYATKRVALSEAVPGSPGPKASRSAATFYVALAVAFVLPIGAIALYRTLGEPRALDPAALIASDSATDHGADMQAAIAKLADKMRQNPDDPEGWALLGRAYQATQRFTEARDALKHARDLAPEDAQITVAYAEALALASVDHRIQGESRELLETALKTDPQNQRALWLIGIADSQAGKYDEAIATWNRLLPLLPPQSDVAASIKKQIAQAQATRDGKPLPADEEDGGVAASTAQMPTTAQSASAPSDAAKSTPANSPQITVKVALDPTLKDKIAASDVLFVFAKAASGPPMPLAIAKLTAAQLPTTVVLTDGMSMLPSMKLSTFPQIIVGARISKSGQAIAQSGDLQTLSAPLPITRTQTVELTIDRIVP